MNTSRTALTLVTVGIVLAVIGAFFASNYILYVATAAAWLAVLAISFDVLIGYTGYLSLAHGALYGVGAYATANLTSKYGVNFWLALLLSGIIAAAVGTFVAGLAFRTRGLYFAVLTLGIGLIGYQLFVVLEIWTGGIMGFVGIPSPPQPFGLEMDQSRYNLLLTLLFVWITYLASFIFVRSPIGVACIAIREDQTLARAVGMKINEARLSAFAFSSFFAGIAGSLFASMSNFVGPDSFNVLTAGFQLVVTVVVGGMGTLWGPILGAILLTSLPEVLRGASHYSLLAYGIMLLVVIMFAPRGLAGMLRFIGGKLRPAPKVVPEPPTQASKTVEKARP
ncbi:MAG: branched-chain amino acid ABC transporter permease [Rhizobium sp.]|nr:branched-chain amino acid ABC transporter permease [Rhizobium sp.]